MFKLWLVEIEKSYDFYRNILLGKLNLDRTHGLSQTLNTWEPEQLISILNGLGEFKKLRQETQNQVVGQIRSQMGTLGDLIHIMSSTSNLGNNG